MELKQPTSLHRVPWDLVEVPSGPVIVPSGPILLADAKRYARITHDTEDFLAESMLAGAIEYAETATRRTIQYSVWDLVLESFSCSRWIELRRPPILEIDELKYRDSDDVWIVIPAEEYELELDGDHARIGPLTGESWPSVSSSPRSVRIRYRAGYRPHDYVASEDVVTPPLLGANLLTGILELFTFRFDNRGVGSTNRLVEVGVPSSIDGIFWSERVDL
jgi:uncharacterized phiE125 gp8 family phage protein